MRSLLIKKNDAIALFTTGFLPYAMGDYATALREWTPLAEQGDADAQISGSDVPGHRRKFARHPGEFQELFVNIIIRWFYTRY